MVSQTELSTRQRQILDVARTLLATEGRQALTVSRIADALAIKPPSLYKHFSGKRVIEAALIAEGLEEQARQLAAAGNSLARVVAAYRAYARANPQLYRLMTDGTPPRDLLPRGLEARAAATLTRVTGDQDVSRAVWAFAHGMVELELADRFPPWADLDAAWAKAVAAFTPLSR